MPLKVAREEGKLKRENFCVWKNVFQYIYKNVFHNFLLIQKRFSNYVPGFPWPPTQGRGSAVDFGQDQRRNAPRFGLEVSPEWTDPVV